MTLEMQIWKSSEYGSYLNHWTGKQVRVPKERVSIEMTGGPGTGKGAGSTAEEAKGVSDQWGGENSGQ